MNESSTMSNGSTDTSNPNLRQSDSHLSTSRAIAVAPGLSPPSTAQRPVEATGGLTALHSLRRCWPQMLLAGVVCGALFAAVGYYLFQPKYRSNATLRLHSKSPRLAFQVDDAEHSSQFDVFKRTQRELVISDNVLLVALKSPELMASPIVKQVAATGDPVVWLRRQLRVEFPGDAEIMSVSMESDNPILVKAAVNAVVSAYVSYVDGDGQSNRATRIAELKTVQLDQEDKARRLRSRLNSLTNELGSGDKDTLSAKQQFAMQHIAQLQTELTRVQLEKITAELDSATLKDRLAARNGGQEGPQPVAGEGSGANLDPKTRGYDLEEFVRRDSAVTVQREALAKAQLALEEAQKRVGDSKSQFLATFQARVNQEKESLQKLEATAREEFQKRYATAATVSRQEALLALQRELESKLLRVHVLTQHESALAERLAQATEAANKVGTSSVGIELTRVELERLEAINNKIGLELDTLEIESKSRSRVDPLSQARDPQGSPRDKRLVQAGMFGLMGFLLPCAGLLWFDFQRKLVNGAEDVNGLSRIRTLGAIPIVRKNRILNQAPERGALVMREAMDGIRTVLIREADISDYRVIQVTSAVGGEAKTTFAGQLARSLARAHRRTVLVDMDLRRPTLHEAFERDGTSGVCELLRGDAQLEEVIRPSDQESLHLVFAGRCDGSALAALTKNNLDDMVARLREQFEFVIIDSPPVLPVVDSLLIAQRADAVILTAMRDVSRAPQMREARDRLSQVGANVIGSVVTTKENRSYYGKSERYLDV